MTITEALAELKTVQARLEKKHQAVATYLMRDARLKDPLEKEGGSVEFVKRERQAMSDLQLRKVALRTSIQRSNLETIVTINGKVMSVAEWLTWRRECATFHGGVLNSFVQGIKQVRDRALKEGRTIKPATSGVELEEKDVVVNLDERKLMEEVEQHETTLGELDGRLSLLNATTHINIT